MVETTIRILAIDGGGVGGIIPAQLLTRLLADHPQLIEKSDIFAGTSTGGLIALGLADQRGPEFVASLYLEKGSDIFRRLWNRAFPFALWWAKYAPDGLRSAMELEFGGKSLADLAKPVVIPTVALQRPDRKHTPAGIFLSTVPLKAGRPELTHYNSNQWSCVDAALATSAAPTYFPAHVVGKWILWDGGLVANNPSAVALGEARRVYPPDTNFTVLSLGTGYGNHATAAGDWGQLRAVVDIIATALDTSVGSTAFLLRLEMQDRYLRLSFEMPDYEIDDPSAIPRLRDFVNESYDRTKLFGQTDGTDVDVLAWLKQWW